MIEINLTKGQADIARWDESIARWDQLTADLQQIQAMYQQHWEDGLTLGGEPSMRLEL